MAFKRRLLGCFGLAGGEQGAEPEQAGRGGGGPVNLRSLSLEDLSRTLATTSLHAFTLDELKAVTKNFSSTNFLGEGGFGPVYRGYVDGRLRPGLEPQHVAVKYLDSDGVQGHREWLAEVVYLGMLSHPHLVKLIGFCNQDEQRMLVYEYMPRRSLENHLFKNLLASLPWSTRLKIAVGAAKGLAFLHEAETPVIYRDFKASNILLDSDYTAKLSDFGLAKEGPQGDATHVTTRVMGTHGYAAPEYILTGHLTAKSDVYSFGVVLLELLTGRRSVDKRRRGREQNLVDWARPYLRRADKLHRFMDPSLELQYSSGAAHRAAQVAHQCLQSVPKSRPHVRDVVDALEPLLALDADVPMGPFVFTVGDELPGDAGGAANAGDDESAPGGRQGKMHVMSAIHAESPLRKGDSRYASAVKRPESPPSLICHLAVPSVVCCSRRRSPAPRPNPPPAAAASGAPPTFLSCTYVLYTDSIRSTDSWTSSAAGKKGSFSQRSNDVAISRASYGRRAEPRIGGRKRVRGGASERARCVRKG